VRLCPWLANPGVPAMSPYAYGKKGTCHSDTIIIYGGRKEGWWEGKQPRNYGRMQNGATTNMRDPRACGQQKTIDYTGLPVLAQDMHWCRCKNEHTKCKGTQTLMNALV